MAQRKASKVSEARKKAEEAARKIQERQSLLLSLAEDFFAVEDSAGIADYEKKINDYETKVQELKQKIADARTEAENEQSLGVQRLKNEGISNNEIAERLMLSLADVGRLLKTAKEVEQINLAQTSSSAEDEALVQTD